MNDDRWQRIRQLFDAALELKADQREEFLTRECAGDSALRQEVDALLAASSQQVTDDLGAIVKSASQELPDDYAGKLIGSYRVIRRLGQGGMGLVLLAVRDDDEYQKQVAIKLIRSEFASDDMKQRFRRERQILATLEHPNIARLIDGGSTERGEPYVVMEYVEGLAIDTYCRQQQLTTAQRLRLFCTVSDAVHEAHRLLIVHRDIKPGNILVTSDGTPKLLDFGIAKLIGSPTGDQTITAITGPGVRLLTPEYASPEQVKNAPITTASDTYSLGILLYELLTDVRPFRFKDRLAQEIERVICEEMPERPSTAVSSLVRDDTSPGGDSSVRHTSRLRRELAGDLDNIVMMALRKESQRRYRSAADLADDLRRHMDGMPVSARPDTWSYRSSKFLRRHSIAVATAAAFVILLAGSAMTLAIQSARVARQRDRAVAAETDATVQRDRARDAEQEARLEADTATQVAEFLVGLFTESAPMSAEAAEMTIRDVLDRGAERVSRELATQPAIQARMMDVIGRVYGQLQIMDASKKLTTAAMELRKQTYGEEHLEIAESLHSMGALHYSLGEFDASGSYYRQALDMRRKLIGKDHPAIAGAIEGIASVKHYKGEFPEAEKYYRESLAMLERIHGEKHPEVARATHGLAAIVMAGAYRPAEETEAMYRKALARYQELYGDEHLATVDCMSDLAVILKNREAYDEAEPFYRKVVEVRRRVLGKNHPQYAQSINNYATFLRRMDRNQEAESMYREALEIYGNALGPESPFLAVPMVNLAAVLSKLDNHEESLRIARDAEAISVKASGDKHWLTHFIRVQIGWSLFKLERLDEGESVLLDAHEALLATLGPKNARTDAAREKLAQFYEARDMTERAAEFSSPTDSE